MPKICFNSRQKRKLDEMYDQLRNEYDSVKRSAIQPASNFYSRNETDLFSNPNIMDKRETGRKGSFSFSLTQITILLFGIQYLSYAKHSVSLMIS